MEGDPQGQGPRTLLSRVSPPTRLEALIAQQEEAPNPAQVLVLRQGLTRVYRTLAQHQRTARLTARKLLHQTCTTLIFRELRKPTAASVHLLGHEEEAHVFQKP